MSSQAPGQTLLGMSKAAGTGQVPGYPGTVKHVILELLAPAKLPATPTLPTQKQTASTGEAGQVPGYIPDNWLWTAMSRYLKYCCPSPG